MVGRRVQLAQLLDRSGALEGLLRVQRRFGAPWITVLGYHHIKDATDDYPFDRGVIDASPGDFDEQVGTLKRYCSVVGIDELRAHFAQGRPLPPNPAMITFDDGYRTCHDAALPVLQRHGVKAVFFIATQYIEERRIFWWDRITYLVRNAKADRLILRYPDTIELDLRGDRVTAIGRLLDLVKQRFDLDLARLLDDLAEGCDTPWDDAVEAELAQQMICTWDHVRALRDAGMDVQSHTRSHRVLTTLPADRIEHELAGSKADLEKQLGKPVYAISYPVGRPIAEGEIRDAISAAGYELGFSYGTGVIGRLGRRDTLNLPRVGFSPEQPLAFFRGALAIPALGYKH